MDMDDEFELTDRDHLKALGARAQVIADHLKALSADPAQFSPEEAQALAQQRQEILGMIDQLRSDLDPLK